MIKKLRRKFILINMLIVGVVLLAVFAAVMVTSYQSLRSDINRSLTMAVDLRDKPGGKPQIGTKPGIGGDRDALPAKAVAVYAVLTDESGSILETGQNNASIDGSVLQQAIALARSADHDEGRLSEVSLYYMRRQSPEGIRLAFADTGYLTSSLRETAFIAVLIGIGCMAVFFVISFFLAGWALRPVSRAWAQQQQFVADASHELKTPLTVILANQKILLSHPGELVAAQRKWVDSTEAEAEHMRRLVDDLLFLAQSDSGKMPLELADIDCSELCYSILLQFEPVAYERKVTLDSQIHPGLLVRADHTALRQLIHILLDNACKYAGEGGRVFLRLDRQQNITRLSVRNSGQPIPAENLAHIFERFYRSDKARTQGGGFGLGLAIAKSIADRHGWALSAESSPAAGTTFIVSIG